MLKHLSPCFVLILLVGCVRSGYEDNELQSFSTIGDGSIFSSGDGRATCNCDATNIPPNIDLNQVSVSLELTRNNQSCGTAGQIDGTQISNQKEIKIRINPSGAMTSDSVCFDNWAPFILRINNAPADYYVACYYQGEINFTATTPATTCNLNVSQVYSVECSTNTGIKVGQSIVAGNSNYLIICRNPAQGPTVIYLMGS